MNEDLVGKIFCINIILKLDLSFFDLLKFLKKIGFCICILYYDIC